MTRNSPLNSSSFPTPTSTSTPSKIKIPLSPTSSLPPLSQLPTTTTLQISTALDNLRLLYWPPSPIPLPKTIVIPKRNLPKHLQHIPLVLNSGSNSIPDSGYASGVNSDDEDEGEGDEKNKSQIREGEEWIEPDVNQDIEDDLEVLRADIFERTFAIRWVTGFISRSDMWIELEETEAGDNRDKDGDEREGDEGVTTNSSDDVDEELELESRRMKLLEEATSILTAFTADEEEEEFALTRTFNFPLPRIDGEDEEGKEKVLKVELNDAPVSKEDHTSVGLQSWGSSILLAERMVASSITFSLDSSSASRHNRREKSMRILELGAGTGLLSIVTAKVLAYNDDNQNEKLKPIIVATDYHPDVLENLSKNVETNFPNHEDDNSPPIIVKCLDWEYPSFEKPLDERFDLIFAADVIYHPDHAAWIKSCVEKMLRLPLDEDGQLDEGGVFWLMIPIRTTGRHDGMYATVDALFPEKNEEQGLEDMLPNLVILEKQEIGRQGGVGRADEGGYKLFKIGWET